MNESLGILGGTFDPVHLGHLASVREIASAFSLSRVLLVLSARPPHKQAGAQAPIDARLAMLRLATYDAPAVEASPIEIERPGPSYTTDTLAELCARQPAAKLSLILGIDAYREIDTWHQPGRLLELADLIVTSRPGDPLSTAEVKPPVAAADFCWYDSAIGCYRHRSGHRLFAHQLLHGVAASSSDIRNRIRNHLPVDHLVHIDVAAYIERHRLYA